MKEALELALEALETERDIYREHDEDGAPEYIHEAITAIKAALAQQEQEPVAWMKPHEKCDRACMYVCTEGFTQFPKCATEPYWN